MSKIDRALLDRLAERARESIEHALEDCSTGRCASPDAITLLLRLYAVTGRVDFRDSVGAALAQAMHQACISSTRDDSSAWLTLFVEAAALSEDERLRATIDSLADALASGWPAQGSVASISRSIAAALRAAGEMEAAAENANLVARAIDEMERIVGHAYAPGAGVVHDIGGGAPAPGTLDDHAALASTLLVAHAATGRLPYAMLADELMQFARRGWWDPSRGWNAPLAESSEAIRVMCGLAVLYRDDDYRRAAVLAELDYAAEASLAVNALGVDAVPPGDAAVFGLAVFELLAIQSGS